MSENRIRDEWQNSIRFWLIFNMAWILVILAVGGLTRLTNSGLSMVDWRPIMGVIPPLNELDWARVFSLYQSSPEYQKINHGMSLEDFKYIFYWEYTHRVFARLAGVIFFIPLIFFYWRGAFLSRRYLFKVTLAGVFGGLQGLLGWYMVKSGLVNNPQVSHLRLASHLGLALFILCYIYWIFLDLKPKTDRPTRGPLEVIASILLLGLVSLQITYGAFVSGLKAGYRYNEWPMMGEGLVPLDAFIMNSLMTDILYNPSTVQFIHRSLAYLVFCSIILVCFYEAFVKKLRLRFMLVYALSVLLQVGLGVATLLLIVPKHLALTHQLGGVAVLLLTVYWCHHMIGSRRIL